MIQNNLSIIDIHICHVYLSFFLNIYEFNFNIKYKRKSMS